MAGAFTLHPGTTATSRRGDVVTDGPFLKAKEVVAGFYVIEAPDLDVALEVAAQNPVGHRQGIPGVGADHGGEDHPGQEDLDRAGGPGPLALLLVTDARRATRADADGRLPRAAAGLALPGGGPEPCVALAIVSGPGWPWPRSSSWSATGGLAGYHYLPAIKAGLLRRLGRTDEASTPGLGKLLPAGLLGVEAGSSQPEQQPRTRRGVGV
jgi:hypothetical protein